LICVDLIELGMPFTDPIADGPTIQKSNTVRAVIRHPTL
jgi:tryptophan synthase alpha subunit